MITDTFETANVLNEFFTSVFTDEDVGGLSEPAKVFKKTTEEALEEVKFTPNVMLKKLTHSKPYKAPGVDNLNLTILREVASAIASPLSEIFTESMAKGEVPADWKCANMTPLYKKNGSKSQPGNYRPVSLTPQRSKMMESIIRDSVVEHLQIHNLIKTSQRGFMKG